MKKNFLVTLRVGGEAYLEVQAKDEREAVTLAKQYEGRVMHWNPKSLYVEATEIIDVEVAK